MGFVEGEKGVMTVGTCKSRVKCSVTAILRSGKAVFTMNSEGTSSQSRQKSGEGRWDGGAGQAEKQEVSILRTHTLCGEGLCSVLTSCVTSCSVLLSGSLCGSKMLPANLCLQIYVQQALDKKEELFDFFTTWCCSGPGKSKPHP